MFTLVAAAVVAGARAADEDAQLEHRLLPSEIQRPPPAALGLWEEFQAAVEEHANDEFANQFHPLSQLNFDLRFADGGPAALRDRPGAAARHAFSKSLVSGLREATVDLPIMSWLHEREEILVGLLENSLGSVDEEAVAPLSLSYQRAERSWWEGLAHDDRFRYGLRPFRTDPYAYFSVGLKDGNRTLLLANVRYHYVHFGDHSFELALSAPLGSGLSLDAGTSYQFGQHDEAKRVALKLCKEFKNGGVLHIGLEVRDHPALIAGISIPM